MVCEEEGKLSITQDLDTNSQSVVNHVFHTIKSTSCFREGFGRDVAALHNCYQLQDIRKESRKCASQIIWESRGDNSPDRRDVIPISILNERQQLNDHATNFLPLPPSAFTPWTKSCCFLSIIQTGCELFLQSPEVFKQ